jgi:D-alanine-D-alanine ligase
MIKVGVLFGGRSGEHNVSLCSAASVISSLDKTKYEIIAIGIDVDGKWYVQDSPEIIDDSNFGRIMNLKKNGEWSINHYQMNNKLYLFDHTSNKKIDVDVIFPVIHGTNCEDGTIQGLLELAMVPYAGADHYGSAVGMDKDITKRLLQNSKISVVPWITITKNLFQNKKNEIIENIEKKIGYPLFVKPAKTGSSVGINKVKEKTGLVEAIEFAFQFDNKILIEIAIDVREIECAILGNDDPEASVCGEVSSSHEFYSYDAKYIDDNGASIQIPANITEELSNEIRSKGIEAYKILSCSGMARVDFFIDKNNNDIYFNEINTLPGFTGISMYPKLWEASGLKYQHLLDKLIELAFKRHEEKLNIKTQI